MYAVIRTGGKQYRVAPGQRLRVERLPGAAGDQVEFTDVLMLGGAEGLAVGAPTVEGARVVAEIVDQGRGRKIPVFKYKNKIRYRRLIGHRQHHTELFVREIVGADGSRDAVAERPQRTAVAEAEPDPEQPEDAPEDAGADEAVEESEA